MNDLVEVKIVHSPCDAHRPVHEQGWLDLPACPQHLIQLSLGAVLHDDAVTWSLGANTSERVDKDTRNVRKSAKSGKLQHDRHFLCYLKDRMVIFGCPLFLISLSLTYDYDL